MKKITLIAILLAVGCSPEQSSEETEQVSTDPVPAALDEAPRYDPVAVANAEIAIRSEAIVKGVVFDPSSSFSWNIAVLPDGSGKHGLAEYFCIVLGENGARDDRTIVRILDATKANRYGDAYASYSLGSVRCGDTTWLN